MLITLNGLTEKFDLKVTQLYRYSIKGGIDVFLTNLKIDFEKKGKRSYFELTKEVAIKLVNAVEDVQKYTNSNGNRERYIHYLENYEVIELKEAKVNGAIESKNKMEDVRNELERLYDLDTKIKSLGLNEEDLIKLGIIKEQLLANNIELFDTHMIFKKGVGKLTVQNGEVIIVFN